MRIKAFRKTSVSIFGKSGGLFERQVRKMACHFAPPSEFRTPQKYQLRFSLRKRPMRRGLWYFLSAQKVRKKLLFDGATATRNLEKTMFFLSTPRCCPSVVFSIKQDFYMFFVAQRTKRPAHEKKQS